MSTTVGYFRFLGTMNELAQSHLLPIAKGEDGSRTDAYLAFDAVFSGMTEITSTYEALKFIETLLSVEPPRSKKIEKDTYLKFLVTSYLQEIYILQERMTSYAKRIERMYSRHLGENPSSPALAALVSAIAETFRGITKTRGAHVHAERFFDRGLNLLAMMSIIEKYGEKVSPGTEAFFRISRDRWLDTINKNNLATMQVLNVYFDWLYPIVTRDGKAYLPPRGRTRRDAKT